MYSRCPNCFVLIPVDATMLVQGHGDLRCSSCGTAYHALPTLFDQAPESPSASAPDIVVDTPAKVSLRTEPTVANAQRSLDLRHETRPSTPIFVRRHVVPQTRRWPWLMGSALLLLSFGTQLAYAERDWLLSQPSLRPWLDQACASLHCTLPIQSNAAYLSLVARDIRPHPSVRDALIISATLRNDATFAQPFPMVEITLSDLDEHRVAMRRFAARDYVSDSKTLSQGLAAGNNVALVFEVADPGKNAVAFEFKFF